MIAKTPSPVWSSALCHPNRTTPLWRRTGGRLSAVETRLDEVREAGCRAVRLDLRGLKFIDSSGLHLILRYGQEAKRDGVSLEVVPGVPAVQRVFELAGVTALLPFVAA
jgi:anti-anti-sigma factor